MEERCEIQYCVILREGNDKGLKHYVRTDKKTIDGFFENFKFGDGCPSTADMGHVVGQEKGEIIDKIHYVKGKIDSLVFECQNEITANKCAEYFKLPIPFPNKR